MKKRSSFYLYLIFCLLFVACKGPKGAYQQASKADGHIQIALIQLNDVYEIAGVKGGQQGNLARVAHYIKELKKTYPHSLVVMAGDFLNPSLINTMRYEGERIRGRQMVETLNALDLDLATFGNHEFDFDYVDLQKRIDESRFDWIASDLLRQEGEISGPFYKTEGTVKSFIPKTRVYTFEEKGGNEVKLGFFSATIDSNPREYVRYLPTDSCVMEALKFDGVVPEILVGLTHLSLPEDIALAKKFPQVDLIMGGHEHDHKFEQVGTVRIAKADANAKSLYVHVLDYQPATQNLTIESTLVPIGVPMPLDSAVEELIEKWQRILESEIRQVVPDPYEVVYRTTDTLDGREKSVRHHQGGLGKLITDAMRFGEEPHSDLALFNSGGIRIDDQLTGEIVAIDIFRTLPFGGSIWEVQMTGALIKEILTYSESHAGTGAYIQYNGLSKTPMGWTLGAERLVDDTVYSVAINDFLMKGYDIPFLTEEHPGVRGVRLPNPDTGKRYDIRAAIIAYLSSL